MWSLPKQCLRLVVHLNANASCSMKLDMTRLKMEYSKYRSRLRFKNHAAKKKVEETRQTKGLHETINRTDAKEEQTVRGGVKIENRENLGQCPNRGGRGKKKNQKCPNFNLGILKTEGGGSLFFKNVPISII